MYYNIMGKDLNPEVWTYIKKAQKAATGEELTEASLGRVFYNIGKNYSSFAIITYHNALSADDLKYKSKIEREKMNVSIAVKQKENREAKHMFFDMLNEMNLGYAYFIGHGLEEYNGEVVSIREPCYVLTGITIKQAKKLMKELNQPGFVYMGPETDDKLCLLNEKGNIEESCDYFSLLKVAEFYSKAKKKSSFSRAFPNPLTKDYGHNQFTTAQKSPA